MIKLYTDELAIKYYDAYSLFNKIVLTSSEPRALFRTLRNPSDVDKKNILLSSIFFKYYEKFRFVRLHKQLQFSIFDIKNRNNDTSYVILFPDYLASEARSTLHSITMENLSTVNIQDLTHTKETKFLYTNKQGEYIATVDTINKYILLKSPNFVEFIENAYELITVLTKFKHLELTENDLKTFDWDPKELTNLVLKKQVETLKPAFTNDLDTELAALEKMMKSNSEDINSYKTTITRLELENTSHQETWTAIFNHKNTRDNKEIESTITNMLTKIIHNNQISTVDVSTAGSVTQLTVVTKPIQLKKWNTNPVYAAGEFKDQMERVVNGDLKAYFSPYKIYITINSRTGSIHEVTYHPYHSGRRNPHERLNCRGTYGDILHSAIEENDFERIILASLEYLGSLTIGDAGSNGYANYLTFASNENTDISIGGTIYKL